MKLPIFALALIISINSVAQTWHLQEIYTAAPFLNINQNARINGFGEIGVVAPSFYNEAGIMENPGLLSKHGACTGANLSYQRYMPKLIDNAYMFQANFHYSINAKNSIAYNYRHYTLGEVYILGSFTPNEIKEFAHQLSYSHVFNEHISAGISSKLLTSDIFGSAYFNGIQHKAISTFTLSMGTTYNNHINLTANTNLNYQLGASINNFGSKLDYGLEDVFLPTTINLGILLSPTFKLANSMNLSIDLAYQAQKLLVPSPPVYLTDGDGNPISDEQGNYIVEYGKDPNISSGRALYQSFYDAPGGASEELQEIMHRTALELRLSNNKQNFVALRFGSINQHEQKSMHSAYTAGIGIGFAGFSLNYSYKEYQEDAISSLSSFTLGFNFFLNKADSSSKKKS